MTQKVIHWVSGTAQTTVASPATIASFDLTTATLTGVAFDNCTVLVEGAIVGSHATDFKGGAWKGTRTFRSVAGTITAVDAAVVVGYAGTLETGISGATFDIDFTGTTIRLRATGIAANTINWFGDLRLRIYQP